LRNQVIQKRDSTIDVAAANLEGLIKDITELKSKWSEILNECNVCEELQIEMCPPKRLRKKPRRLDYRSDTEDSDIEGEGGSHASESDPRPSEEETDKGRAQPVTPRFAPNLSEHLVDLS